MVVPFEPPTRAIPTARRQWLAVNGIVVGLWAALPAVVSPELNVAESKEIADHLIPAIVVVALSVASLVLARRGTISGMVMFVAGLAVCLAGLWMVATHVPLVAQAARHDGVSWEAAVWHSASAVAVALLGILWVMVYWDPASAERHERPKARAVSQCSGQDFG